MKRLRLPRGISITDELPGIASDIPTKNQQKFVQTNRTTSDAYFKPSLRSWIVAILSFFIYSGALLSLFISLLLVSWAVYFWGLVSGMTRALSLRKPRQNKLPLRYCRSVNHHFKGRKT
jgi:hypothetical protein